MQSKVTILTTVYNTNLSHLKDCIESVLNQTYQDFNYLIIDDNSPNKEVVKFIKSYKDPRISFYKNDINMGVSETINKALTLSESKYIIRADHDDISSHDRVEKQIDYLDKNPHLSAICSWEITIDEKGNKIRSWESAINNYGEFLGPILVGISPIWHPSLAIKREDLISLGGFNKYYIRAEDGEVTANLALKRYSASIVPEYLLLQRNHGSNQTNRFNKEMVNMKNLIHFESINYFLSSENAKDLSSFLRMEKERNFNKEYILKMNLLLKKLFNEVKNKQKLSEEEFFSLKKTVFKRIGFGIPLIKYYKRFPSFIFMFFFYLFSPLYLNRIYEILSKNYHAFRKLKFLFFKGKKTWQ
jgi:glycosyltransferase involved in cell wall biosynthesis